MYHIKNIPADYWLILCLLITDPLPASAFAANVICYILLYPVTVQMTVFTIVTLFIFICEVGCVCVLRGNDLHSTMFIFISGVELVKRVFFIQFTFHYVYIYIITLHIHFQCFLNIYIPLCLYLYGDLTIDNVFDFSFTFHYVYIYIKNN